MDHAMEGTIRHAELIALISRTAALMEQFERRCDRIELRQQSLNDNLQWLVQQVPATVRQSADESLQRLPAAVVGSVRNGLEQPVAAYEQRLQQAGLLLQQASQTLAGGLDRMEALHRRVVWKITGTVLCSLALLLAGGAWLSLQYRADIREQQLAAELLRAYNQADVTLCDGRLCANVDRSGRRHGVDGRYLPVRSR